MLLQVMFGLLCDGKITVKSAKPFQFILRKERPKNDVFAAFLFDALHDAETQALKKQGRLTHPHVYLLYFLNRNSVKYPQHDKIRLRINEAACVAFFPDNSEVYKAHYFDCVDKLFRAAIQPKTAMGSAQDNPPLQLEQKDEKQKGEKKREPNPVKKTITDDELNQGIKQALQNLTGLVKPTVPLSTGPEYLDPLSTGPERRN